MALPPVRTFQDLKRYRVNRAPDNRDYLRTNGDGSFVVEARQIQGVCLQLQTTSRSILVGNPLGLHCYLNRAEESWLNRIRLIRPAMELVDFERLGRGCLNNHSLEALFRLRRKAASQKEVMITRLLAANGSSWAEKSDIVRRNWDQRRQNTLTDDSLSYEAARNQPQDTGFSTSLNNFGHVQDQYDSFLSGQSSNHLNPLPQDHSGTLNSFAIAPSDELVFDQSLNQNGQSSRQCSPIYYDTASLDCDTVYRLLELVAPSHIKVRYPIVAGDVQLISGDWNGCDTVQAEIWPVVGHGHWIIFRYSYADESLCYWDSAPFEAVDRSDWVGGILSRLDLRVRSRIAKDCPRQKSLHESGVIAVWSAISILLDATMAPILNALRARELLRSLWSMFIADESGFPPQSLTEQDLDRLPRPKHVEAAALQGLPRPHQIARFQEYLDEARNSLLWAIVQFLVRRSLGLDSLGDELKERERDCKIYLLQHSVIAWLLGLHLGESTLEESVLMEEEEESSLLFLSGGLSNYLPPRYASPTFASLSRSR